MSKLTKLVLKKENKKNFFKLTILLKKSVSMTKIKIGNLTRSMDFKIGLCQIGLGILIPTTTYTVKPLISSRGAY